MIKEQLIEVCPRNLNIYLPERAPRALDELRKIAQQYLTAQKRQLHQKIKFEGRKYKTENPNYKKMNEEKRKDIK